MFHYVEDKEFLRRVRGVCGELMQDFCHTLKDAYDIGANFCLVGSGARNLIVQNASEPIDLDYNLEIDRCVDFEDCRAIKACAKKAFDKAFEKYDMILGPAAPTTAPKLGQSLSDPIKMYLGDIYTISVNLAGLPGISVPCGVDSKGLPIGLQLIGDCFQEKKIIQAAYAYEQTREPAFSPLLAE